MSEGTVGGAAARLRARWADFWAEVFGALRLRGAAAAFRNKARTLDALADEWDADSASGPQ